MFFSDNDCVYNKALSVTMYHITNICVNLSNILLMQINSNKKSLSLTLNQSCTNTHSITFIRCNMRYCTLHQFITECLSLILKFCHSRLKTSSWRAPSRMAELHLTAAAAERRLLVMMMRLLEAQV